MHRSRRPELFCKKVVLTYLPEACNFILENTRAQLFSSESFVKLKEHLWWLLQDIPGTAMFGDTPWNV